MPLHVKHGQVFVGSSTLGRYVNEGLREPGLPLARRAMPAIIRMRVTSNANYLFISLRMQPHRHAASVPIRSGARAPWSCCALGLYTLDFGLADNCGDYKNVRFASLVFLVIGLAVDFDILVSYVVSYVVSWLPASLSLFFSILSFVLRSYLEV